jgi:type 2 lantibiotic biosynthesis protein LanM
MQLTRDECHAIAIKSQSILERRKYISVNDRTQYFAQTERKVNARLKEWRDLVAEGDENLFKKRLAYDGLDLDAARRLLGDCWDSRPTQPPAWTALLNDVLKTVAAFPRKNLEGMPSTKYAFLQPGQPRPFEELFIPIVLMARHKLLQKVGASYDFLTEDAANSIDSFLLLKLTEISSRVLELEFKTYLACLQLTGISYDEASDDKNCRKHYLGFIRSLYDGELAAVFKEYCVLARRIALRIDQWIEMSAEFLHRLHNDLPEIQQLFNLEKLGKVSDVKLGISDSHDNGRTVMILTFESGFKLVYKPKNMGLEAGYFKFVEHLNGQSIPLKFKVLKVIDRGSYGWVEFIKQTPMKTHMQVQQYFQRAGMLLALIYIFDGIDFHSENVIACGEHPVPIDMETFFHHRINYPQEIKSTISAANEIVANSVLRAHFLPQLYKISDKYMDLTGMGAMPGQEISIEALRWKNINTDAMEYNLENEKPSSQSNENAPQLGELYLSPEDYTNDIVGGFEFMYRFLANNQNSLLAQDSLFTKLFHNKARFVFRGTALYVSILKKSAHPDFQREGIDLSIQLDVVSRPFVPLDEKSALWPLIAEEENSMWNLDVPKFTVRGDCDAIEFENGTRSPKSFVNSPYEVVKDKFKRLSNADLTWQVGLIKGSMEARNFRKARIFIPEKPLLNDADTIPLLGKNDLLSYAVIVANEMRAQAAYSAAGEPSWIILKGAPNSELFMLADMKFSLYDGNPGVALFLAALEKVVPGSGFRDMGRASVALMIRWLRKVRPSEIKETGIGGFYGLGSMAYSLTRLSQLLDDPELLSAAIFASSLFSKKNIDDDSTLDVISGAAGAILGLLALYKATGNRDVLENAIYCGKHLLKNRVVSQSGFRAWKCTQGSPPLTGFSHGAAGIAYSLVKLYEETNVAELLLAAEEAYAFETAIFDDKEKNWPDLRVSKDKEFKNDGPAFMSAWCHGAPGIALGRLGTLDILDTPAIQRDIQIALETTKNREYQRQDHLCCGNAGRAEIMLTAGLKLSIPRWKHEALRLTSTVVHRAKENGAFKPTFLFDLYNPTMFQGSAGLGYHLLRLAEPDQLPSVLLLE